MHIISIELNGSRVITREREREIQAWMEVSGREKDDSKHRLRGQEIKETHEQRREIKIEGGEGL